MTTPRWGAGAHPAHGCDADGTRPVAKGWNGWIGVFYAGVWLIFLVYPITEAWSRIGTVRGQVGLAATLLYIVAYLWHFLAGRALWGNRERWFHERVRSRVARYAVQVLLAAIVLLALGQSATTVWVFVAVAGLWTWPMRVAFAIAAVIAVGYELLAFNLPGWEHDQSVLVGLLLGMTAVAGGMVASSRAEALSQARRENARLAVQDERNRMSRDLHDILGHSLTVITVKAELAGRLMDVSPQRAKAEVADLERLSRDALVDVRRAVEGYREISLSGELSRARRALSAAGIEASLPGATDDVPTDLRELYAWVVRESVTNVVRHSGAEHCTITFVDDALVVADDGGGPPDGTRDGHGLRGVAERAAAVGAQVATRGLRPHGFELTVTTTRAGAEARTEASSEVAPDVASRRAGQTTRTP